MKSPLLKTKNLHVSINFFAPETPAPQLGQAHEDFHGQALRSGVMPGLAAPAIGAYWEGQGGLYAGVMRGEEGKPDRHIIVPTCELVLGHRAVYGGQGVDEPGATSRFDGHANTRALVESDTDHPAAQWCASLTVEGHNDLYLPAILECALIAANLPDLLEKAWHVSSSQRSAHYAFLMDFVVGSQYGSGKGNECFVRPVRSLPIR